MQEAISDSSTLIHLAGIGRLELLDELEARRVAEGVWTTQDGSDWDFDSGEVRGQSGISSRGIG